MDLRPHQYSALRPILLEVRPKRQKSEERLKRTINGVLWVIRTREPWNELPRRFAPGTTCFKLYHDLKETGNWDKLLRLLVLDLKEHGNIDLTSCIGDEGEYNVEKCKRFIKAALNELEQLPSERDWRWFTLLFLINVCPIRNHSASPVKMMVA